MKKTVSKILALVDGNSSDDNADFITNRIIDGAMNLSTNIIKLHYVQKLHEVFPCAGHGKCASGKRCPIDDEFADWRDEIRDSDVIILGATLEGGRPSVKFDRVMTRLINQAVDLRLDGKKAILVIAGDPSDSPLFVRQKDSLVHAGMQIAAEIMYVGTSAKDDPAIIDRAHDIGSGLRTNWRQYSGKQ